MNLSQVFIERPVATTLLSIGIAMSGILGFILLPVAPLPAVDFPTISIQAALPGASPEIMATSVATPLERQLGRIAGITDMTSSSGVGSTQINVQFELSRDINGAARDVQAAIDAARGDLPSNLPNNPTYRKVNPADAPIMILSLTSPHHTRGQLFDVASTILQQKISQINGVGQVNVGGSSLPGVRIELNPHAIDKYGINIESLHTVLAATTVNRPKGQINQGEYSFDINSNDQLFTAKDYEPLVISYYQGEAVKLSDIAVVQDSVEDVRSAGLANGKPAVLLVLFKQPGANVIETVDKIRQLLPYLQSMIPSAIALKVVMDRTPTIRQSLLDVEFSLILATVLIMVIVYCFLGNVRAALIPSVAVVLSLLGTFAVMYLLDFSLDNLSLMALTIATGFVVDDAVVVLENIERHIEAGMSPKAAAIKAAEEIGFTVLSMSISLIAVFIPLLLMGGIVGRLFREFAITLSIAIVVSLIISLTLTPMMSSRLLKQSILHTPQSPNIPNVPKVQKVQKKYSIKIYTGYEHSLQWALAHPRFMLLIMGATICLTVFLFLKIPKGFFPQQDTGRIVASIQAQQDISFQAMQKKLSAFVDIVGKDAAVENVVGFVGTSNGRSANTGSMFISLQSLKKRSISADGVINRLRSQLAEVPGATLYLQAAQDLVVGGRQGNAQYQYTLSADNLLDLNKWAPLALEKLSHIPGIIDINSDQLTHGLQSLLAVDLDTAARFGISSTVSDATLYGAFGQSQIATLYTPLNQYHVVMEVAPEYWQRPEILKEIYVSSPLGTKIPLSVFANFTPAWTLLAVTHQGQFPAATFSFNLLPGVALGDVVNKINEAIHELKLPNTITGSFRGTAQAFQDSLQSEPYLIMAALLAVYIVLGILYESLIHPITILSTLPSAGVGALLALLLTHTDLSIIALIGMILLIGIVKKNAIMMIDFALHLERKEHMVSRDAIFQAAVLRFRPIMMTTIAAFLGALPLALGLGAGAELRQPLGIAIVGGLLVSQILTIYTTPVMYLTIEKWSKKCRGALQKQAILSN